MILLFNTIKAYTLRLFSIVLPQTRLADTNQRPPNKYKLDYIACAYEGLSVVEKNAKWGFVDLSGNLVIPLIYDDACSFSEGLAKVKKDEMTFIINTKGETVIAVPLDIEVLDDFKEGLMVVKKHDKLGFMDKTGHIIINFQYQNASSFREGLAVVVINDKRGFIDKTGHLVIPAQYDDSSKFFDGLASVKINDKWGVIDKQGQLVIPMIYDFISHFHHSETTDAQFNGEWIKIDKQGHQVADDLDDHHQGICHQKVNEILQKSHLEK